MTSEPNHTLQKTGLKFTQYKTELVPTMEMALSLFAWYIDDSLPQSNSSYTVSTLPVLPTDLYGASGYDIQTFYSGNENQNGGYGSFLTAIPYSGQVDFQVQAFIGHNSTYWYIQHPFFPTIGGLYEPAIAYDSASGWSNTRTITIGENSTSSSPTSTLTVPEFPLLTIISFLVLTIVAGLLVYFKKHKHLPHGLLMQ